MRMKHFFNYLLLGLCGLSTQTCKKNEISENQVQSKPFNLSLLAQPVSEQTKAAYLGLDFAWEAGDLAAIIAPNNIYSPLSLDTLSAGRKVGIFKGTLNGWEDEKEIYLVYPWLADGKERFNQTENSFNFSLAEIQSFNCVDQAQKNKDNARYSLMLGKTITNSANNLSIELNQMLSFIDFKVSNAENYKVREIQMESNDSVFNRSGIFNLSDFSFTPGKKAKRISVVPINNQTGDITLPITLFPVNLSLSGLNKEIFADVIAEDNTSGQLKLFRFNKGVPSKPYEKNTRYLALLDLSTVTPIPYQNEFYISQSVQNASYKECSLTVTISTNGQKWTASGIPDWISLSQGSGETSVNITLKVKTNTNFLPRTGTITFNSGNQQKTLTVNQAMNQEVAGDKAALEAFFAAAGGENWANKSNWLSNKPLGEWRYVKTDNITGRVVSIVIELENLRGKLSEEIYKLSELKELLIFTMEPNSFEIAFTENIKKLQKLETLHCHLSADIPNEIFDLTQLKMLGISGNNSLFNRKFIGVTRFENLKKLERLIVYDFELGSVFPQGILTLKNLQRLQLGLINSRDKFIVVPEQLYDLTLLKELTLYEGYKLHFSSKIGNLINLERLAATTNPSGELTKEFFKLTKLVDVYIGNTYYISDLAGSLTSDISSLKNLYFFQIINCNITGNLPKEIGNLPLLEQFRCDGNRLSGKIPTEITNHPNWDKWSPNRWIIPQQEGYKLEIDKYVSTDFSQDGKIVKLHSATKGKGIDIVVLGDGFVDKEIGTGKIYDLTMAKFKDSFLELEPFKTYKDYFNVYMIRAISKEHGVSDEGNKVLNKFGTLTSQNDYPTCNIEKVQRYVDSLGLDNSHISLVANTYSLGGYTSYISDSNTGKVKTVAQLDLNSDTYTISHEAGGHGFGLLADEYMRVSSDGEVFPVQNIDNIKQIQEKYDIYPNIDFTSDLTKIKWAYMVTHPKYKGIVGAYEGGLYYYKGIWRPEFQSIMGYHVGLNYFNAPSREAIVKQIKKQAGETYSFDDFVANDKMEILISTKSAKISESERKHYPPRIIYTNK